VRPLVLVADAHLTRDDPEVEIFVSFLGKIGSGASAVGILGDLFNLWLGQRKFALPHHLKVLRALEELREGGVRLFYVEGNRDFHLRRAHMQKPFHAISEGAHVESFASWKICATHGDEINLNDRQYRTWKALSKSVPVYGAFSLLPGPVGMKIGESLERKLSGTNLKNRMRFPIEHCVRYGRGALEREGCDAVVMGHFHEERFVPLDRIAGRERGVWILPAFRNSHRFLIFEGDGQPRFEEFRV